MKLNTAKFIRFYGVECVDVANLMTIKAVYFGISFAMKALAEHTSFRTMVDNVPGFEAAARLRVTRTILRAIQNNFEKPVQRDTFGDCLCGFNMLDCVEDGRPHPLCVNGRNNHFDGREDFCKARSQAYYDVRGTANFWDEKADADELAAWVKAQGVEMLENNHLVDEAGRYFSMVVPYDMNNSGDMVSSDDKAYWV